MANTFLTNSIITKETLRILENTLAASGRINREYDDRFRFGGAVLGQTLSVRKPARYIGRLGQAAQVEATSAQVPSLEQQEAQQINALSFLLDLPPDALRGDLSQPGR